MCVADDFNKSYPFEKPVTEIFYAIRSTPYKNSDK